MFKAHAQDLYVKLPPKAYAYAYGSRSGRIFRLKVYVKGICLQLLFKVITDQKAVLIKKINKYM